MKSLSWLDQIFTEESIKADPKNAGWKRHSLEVAQICEELAVELYIRGYEIDLRFAFYYGLVHDIGRITKLGKDNPKTHPIEGWRFMVIAGYPELAMACITHTFANLKDITLVPGMCHPQWTEDCNPDELEYDFIDQVIREKLNGYEKTIYDYIVNIADLMAIGGRKVTIEERLTKTYARYGDKPNRKKTTEAIMANKKFIEALIEKKVENVLRK